MSETRATRKNRSYSLQAYDTNWPLLFSNIKPRIVTVFSDNLIAVEHIGSTSVPGMLAKPQIDILVIVKDLARVRQIYAAMEEIGFTPRGDYIGQHEESFIFDDAEGHRLYSIHTMQQNNESIAQYIIFRDYLRSHPEARQTYNAKKQLLLATYGAADYNAYDFGKEELLLELKAAAKIWDDAGRNTR